MELHGVTMQTGYCQIKIVTASEQVAKNLSATVGADVYELTRVRCANNIGPLYIPPHILKLWICHNADLYSDSLYKFLKEKYNVTISKASDQLEATLAEGKIAKFLEVSSGFQHLKNKGSL